MINARVLALLSFASLSGGAGYALFGVAGFMAGLILFGTGLTLYLTPEEPLPRGEVKIVDHTTDVEISEAL